MDLAETIKAVFGGFTYFLPIMLLLALYRTAWFKGVAGEFMVNLAARLWLEKRHCRLVNNVIEWPIASAGSGLTHRLPALGGQPRRPQRAAGLWLSENERAKFWLGVLTELQSRGLKNILIACVDGFKGFFDVSNTAFPQALVEFESR